MVNSINSNLKWCMKGNINQKEAVWVRNEHSYLWFQNSWSREYLRYDELSLDSIGLAPIPEFRKPWVPKTVKNQLTI